MIAVMKVMADNRLDAIVHKAVEHTPTLIRDGINPPYVNQKGAPHLNTFLIYAASMVVPAGFTPQGLPVGITFFGRPYSEPTMRFCRWTSSLIGTATVASALLRPIATSSARSSLRYSTTQ